MMTEGEVLMAFSFLEKYAPVAMRDSIRMARSACEAVVALSATERLRARSADELELSVTAAVGLAHLGLKTIGAVEEFVALPDEIIMERGKKVHFRKKALKEVRKLMANLGLGRRNGASS